MFLTLLLEDFFRFRNAFNTDKLYACSFGGRIAYCQHCFGHTTASRRGGERALISLATEHLLKNIESSLIQSLFGLT